MDTISSHQISPGSASTAWLLYPHKHQGQGGRVPRGSHLYIKGWLPFHIKCSRNFQWDERRSLGVGVQALASNPLQAAAGGNVAVVSVAERYVLLSWTQVNVFVKPDEQWWACSVIAMARKGAWNEPLDEVSLIVFQVMSKVSVGQFWRQAMQ